MMQYPGHQAALVKGTPNIKTTVMESSTAVMGSARRSRKIGNACVPRSLTCLQDCQLLHDTYAGVLLGICACRCVTAGDAA